MSKDKIKAEEAEQVENKEVESKARKDGKVEKEGKKEGAKIKELTDKLSKEHDDYIRIYDSLLKYLKSKGLEEIEAKGKEFDVDFHDAVTKFPAPSEDMKGKVIDVIQTG